MKILHIFKNTNDKFSEPFIDFIHDNFNKSDHLFYHIGKDIRKNKVMRNNTLFTSNLGYLKFIKNLHNSDKIIIHGLLSPQLVFILFSLPWLLKKCFWCIWGSDLYYFRDRNISFKTDLLEFTRKRVIKNVRGLITFIKGDYDLAKQWYRVKGKYYSCFLYPSNLYKDYGSITPKQSNKTVILLGNSATPSNNHIEVLNKILKFKNTNLEIICPLSYGINSYRDLIISKGKELFGEKFIPITEFISLKEYLELQSQIDIAIFNHNRQQGMGNINTLLGLGKKVYIREEITTWKFFSEHDLKVYSSNSTFDDLFEPINDKFKENNTKIIKNMFSYEKLVKDWALIFGS